MMGLSDFSCMLQFSVIVVVPAKKKIYFWYKLSFRFPNHLSISWDYRETQKWKLKQVIINIYWHFDNDSLSIPLSGGKKKRQIEAIRLTQIWQKKIILLCLGCSVSSFPSIVYYIVMQNGKRRKETRWHTKGLFI